jgi:hypothetical protein
MIPMQHAPEAPRQLLPVNLLDGIVFATSIGLQQLAAVPDGVSGCWAVAAGVVFTLIAARAARWTGAAGDRSAACLTAAAVVPRGMRDVADRRSTIGHGSAGNQAIVVAADRQAWRTLLMRSLTLGAVALLPTCGSLAAVAFLGASPGPEVFLLGVPAGTVLALLAGRRGRHEYLFALAASAFLVVLSSIVVSHPAAALVQTLYAAAASGWLASRREVPGSADAPAVPRFRAALLLPCLAVAAVVAASGGTLGNVARSVGGFMPFSGGDSWNDPWGTDGIGDGENLVAGKRDATSSGPVDSSLYLTSQRPSLYDVWNDQYGEPFRAEHERAIPLDASEVRDSEGKTADSDHAGREFSTVRSGRRRTAKPPDIAARALLTVDGPTPVLLRLAVFDGFDGCTWSGIPADGSDPESRVVAVGDDWMRVGPGVPSESPHHHERHAITVGTLESAVLPLPTGSTRMRIPRMTEPSMYRFAAAELPTLDRPAVPPGTTVSSFSRPGGIDGRDPSPSLAGGPALIDRAATPSDTGPERSWIDSLLEEWQIVVAGPERIAGWELVAAVVDRVRRHALLDPGFVLSGAESDTVKAFLTGARRGPDYQFASATAVVLRHLGFRTRLVSGLRVSGTRRDARSRRVIAAREDVHAWAEILDTSGRWIPLEATPGQRLRGAGMPLEKTIAALVRSFLPTTRAGWWGVIGLTALATVTSIHWRRLADRVVTVAWWLELRRSAACPLEVTWWLVERRGWIAGHPRPAHETVRRWYLAPCRPVAAGADHSEGFVRAFEAVSYGPPDACGDRRRHLRIALAAERIWTLDALLARRPKAVGGFSLPSVSSFRSRRRMPA